MHLLLLAEKSKVIEDTFSVLFLQTLFKLMSYAMGLLAKWEQNRNCFVVLPKYAESLLFLIKESQKEINKNL